MRDRVRSIRLTMVLLAAAVAAAGCSSAGPSPSPTPAPSLVASAAPSVAPDGGSGAITGETGDPGDEPAGSETPAIDFTPGPTGAPAPTSAAARLPGEPDPVLTPGSLNTAVTQGTIASTICTSGWTATIRPPTSYTNSLKVTQIAQYGYTDTSVASYEEDHLISLELGGSPTDPRNLWPEPYTIALADGRSVGAHVKDAFETKLKNQVCTGALTLAEGQAEVGIHWVHFYYHIP
ncbi:MAG: hypothetical protein ABSC46_04720 [Candidatus Limnocylindrales bacterium]|jgi:hypothetical protein